MSLDGVIDAPTWTFDYGFHSQMGEATGAVTDRSRGIPLGRTTYEMFEPAWSTRTVADDPGAPFVNDTTKYVVSATLTTATWRNSEFIGPCEPDAIRSLKGSGTLSERCSRTVLSTSCICSSIRSPACPRLFPVEAAAANLSLAACESYENGVVYLAHRPLA